MNLDIELIAKWATALVAIVSFVKLVIMPFYTLLTSIQSTIKDLQVAIDALRRDIADSQHDRGGIHKKLDDHDLRLNKVEDDVIRIDTYCLSKNRRD